MGQVDDLLIVPHRGEVVMLGRDLNNSPDHATVPIRRVHLDRDRRCLLVDRADVHSTRAEMLRDDRERVDRDDIARDVRYGQMRETSGEAEGGIVEETVVERRPVIEEVVVRRRVGTDEEDSDRV